MAKFALGIIEVKSWSAGMVVLDCMTRAAQVRTLQAELNHPMFASLIDVHPRRLVT